MIPDRIFKDKIARRVMRGLTVFSCLIVLFIAVGLFIRSKPILDQNSISELIFSDSWSPRQGNFGFFPFIMGTVWVTGVAMIIAVPLCLLTAIFLSEYAPKKIREIASPLIDLLAGIPSVVYGIWGVLIVVPLIKNHLAPMFSVFSTGYSVLAAGIVLAIMIFPVIIHVTHEVFRTVPYEMREASLALGATQWQTTKHVVLRKAMPGVIAAVVLGLSRAFGETMAVLMVAGNVPRVPESVFDPSYPLPALIANNYGEMTGISQYEPALLASMLILLLVVLIFNLFSRWILHTVERSVQ